MVDKHVDNAIDVIDQNLVSRKCLALFRIKLVEELLRNNDSDSDICSGGIMDFDRRLQGKLGLPSMFVAILQCTVEDFCDMLRTTQTSTPTTPPALTSSSVVLVSKTTEFKRLQRVISIYERLATFDPTIEEEIGYEGAHQYLSKLLKIDPTSVPSASTTATADDDDDDGEDPNHDAIMEIHDRVCEVVAVCNRSGSFPRMKTPLTKQELQARLPLVFDFDIRGGKCQYNSTATADDDVDDNDDDYEQLIQRQQNSNSNSESTKGTTVLINQVTSRRQTAQKDVGYLMWPAAVILSRYIVSNPNVLMIGDERASASSASPKKILEIGAGCGLVGLVAAALISQRIKDSNNLSRDSHTASTGDEDLDGNRSVRNRKGDKSQQHCVVLSDFNDVVVENLHRNILLNGLGDVATSERLDFYEQEPNNKCQRRRGNSDDDNVCNEGSSTASGWVTPDGRMMDQVDLILASDIICQPEDAYAAARTIDCGLKSTGKALVVLGGSKHRFGVDKFEDACLEQKLLVSKIDDRKFINDKTDSTTNDVESSTEFCDDDMEKCQGFTDVMTYSFWVVEKRCDNR